MMIYFISSHDDPHHPPHHHHLPSACPTRACSTSPGFPLRSVSTPAWTHSASSRSFCPSPSPGLGDRLAAGWEGLRVAGHQGVVLSPRQATRGGGGRWVGPTCWTCRTLFVGGLDALTPLLTGLNRWDLTETRRRAKAEPVNVLPFFSKEFKERG